MSDPSVDLIYKIAGIWGGILSSILGIQKIIEINRKLHLRFTHMRWGYYQELRITNVGQKPIEIIEVGIRLTENKHAKDPFSQTPIFPILDENNKLPKRLSEGESIVYRFDLDEDVINKKNSFSCFVTDSTGKKHYTKKVFLYDLKYHTDVQ